MINAPNHLVPETVCKLIKIRAFKKLLSSLGRIALLTHGNLDDYIQAETFQWSGLLWDWLGGIVMCPKAVCSVQHAFLCSFMK